MAVQEIDEVELMRLQKQDRTVQTLMSNPKAKKKIFEAYKVVDPNARIPELDAEAAVREPVEALEKTVAELQKKISDDESARNQEKTINAIKGGIEAQKLKFKKAGWFDEDIAAVEKLMEEKGTTDFELAAAFYEKQKPAPEIASPRTGGWNFVDQVQDSDKDLKALLDSRGNSESLADKMAHEALNEIRGASRR